MAGMTTDELVQRGIAAVRAGQKEQARSLLTAAVEQDERNEAAWLWLSGATDDPEERRTCLENVLAINPANAAAQAGLRRMAPSRGPGPMSTTAPAEPPARVVSDWPAPSPPTPAVAAPPPAPVEAVAAARPHGGPARVEIDPFGCPYCGGVVSTDEPRCNSCGRSVELRSRQRFDGPWLGWMAAFVALQGIAAAGSSFVLWWLATVERLPAWLAGPTVALVVGRATVAAEGLPSDLGRLAFGLVVANAALGALCVVLAAGLAFRSRPAYFATLLVVGLLGILAVVGAVTGLEGLLAAAFRAVLAAGCLKWVMDSAVSFEWQTHRFTADLDPGPETAMDYATLGARYAGMGMWAKAAAHYQVATHLDGGRPEFAAGLARAYVKLGYPRAALVQAEKAAARAPDDADLAALRDSLAKVAKNAD